MNCCNFDDMYSYGRGRTVSPIVITIHTLYTNIYVFSYFSIFVDSFDDLRGNRAQHGFIDRSSRCTPIFN